MLLPASTEFISLCRSQIALLTQGLGASLAVIYLTEELTESLDTNLVPVVAYPEAATEWDATDVLTALSRGMQPLVPSRLLGAGELPMGSEQPPALPQGKPAAPLDASPSASNASIESGSLGQQQMVMPLARDGVMMGLLVAARRDRSWLDPEKLQIERIAQTLTLACLLDQRGQWMEQDLRHQQMMQAQQQEMLHDLLHQFRNPLTALRTFGKLLMKRLLPGDPNQDVAANIVRESDRLQELLKQFNFTVDLHQGVLLPSSQSSSIDWEAHIESDLRDRLSEEAAPPDKSVPLLPSSTYLTGAEQDDGLCLLVNVLEPLLSSAEAIAQDRQLVLEVDLPTGLPLVPCNSKALREIFSNLIDNALKYTPAGGTVWIHLERHDSPVNPQQAVVIADTGPGIPLDDQDHLFQRHFRGVQANSDIPGTGLGLAIAHDLIRHLGGDIEVFSPATECDLLHDFEQQVVQSQQPGTAFVVWLPERELAR